LKKKEQNHKTEKKKIVLEVNKINKKKKKKKITLRTNPTKEKKNTTQKKY